MERKQELLMQLIEALEQFKQDVITINDIVSSIKFTRPSLEVAKAIQSTNEKMLALTRSLLASGEELLRVKEEEIESLLRTMREISSEVRILSRPSVCEVCQGMGEFPCDVCYESGACQVCHGRGYFDTVVVFRDYGDDITQRTPCPACKGSKLCSICHGTAKMKCLECGGRGRTGGVGQTY